MYNKSSVLNNIHKEIVKQDDIITTAQSAMDYISSLSSDFQSVKQKTSTIQTDCERLLNDQVPYPS